MSELNIKVRKSQDNGSTFRATPDALYMGGVGSAKVDTLHFEVPEEWAGCAITLHVQRLSGALPDPQMLDENNCVVVDRRWTQEKQGSWMLLAVDENGYIAMTKPGQYTCYETIDTNSTTETITPSVYEQFVALVKKWGQAAVDAARAAKELEEQAADSASASAGSAAKAAQSERAAAGSATKASGSASAAEESKTAAATSEANAAKHEEAAKNAAIEAGAKAGTDPTLSIKNAPADAAATGAELAKKANKDLIVDKDGNVLYYSKAAVDELLKKKLDLTGGTMTGQISALNAGDYVFASNNTVAGKDSLISIKNEADGIAIAFGIGNGGKTFGIVEQSRNRWPMAEDLETGNLYFDGDKIFFRGHEDPYVIASGAGYVRFGDGTQICWGETDQIVVSANSTVTATIAYPAAFASGYPAEVSLTIAGNSENDSYSRLVLHTTNRATTNCVIYFKNTSSRSMSPIAQWIVIGRWK